MARSLTVPSWLVLGIVLGQMPASAPVVNVASAQTMHHHAAGATDPMQPGQAAFAAIQEIVGILQADPKTDWSKIDIEALRQHLIDMDNVTLRAIVRSESVPGGQRFIVSGSRAVQGSIRRMVMAHAATMNGVEDWHFEASATHSGAILTVIPPAGDLEKVGGLGFIGVMARGMHHQAHHLMLARGENPHG